MTFPITASNAAVSAIILGLLGIVECFFGYRLFRIVLAIIGFFVGAGLAISLVNSDQTAVMVVVALIGGLIGAVIFYFLYFIGIFLAGLSLGATVGAIVAANLNLAANQTSTNLLIIIGAIIGGLLGIVFSKYIIMLSTAFTGAAQIVYAVLLLLPGLHAMPQISQTEIRFDQPGTVVATLVIIVLALIGFAFQYNMNRPAVVMTRADPAL